MRLFYLIDILILVKTHKINVNGHSILPIIVMCARDANNMNPLELMEKKKQ